MAVRYRNDRNSWVAVIETNTGRETRSFKTEQEAVEYELLISKVCLLRLHSICSVIDWGDKHPGQKEGAARTIRRLGVDKHPKQITMKVLDDYAMQRKHVDKMSSSTVRSELSGLKVMLKRAMRLGWIDVLPLLPEGRTLPTPEARDLVICDEWYRELLLQLEKKEQRLAMQIVIFCRRTGCRIDEALSLTWDRVDISAGQVQFIKTKGINARRLPLSDELKSVLSARKAFNTELVFDMLYTTFYKQYKRAVKNTCKVLGLGLVTQKEWVCHTLRHTRCTELANQGATAPQIQAWAGHKSLATSQRYIHISGVNLNALANC